MKSRIFVSCSAICRSGGVRSVKASFGGRWQEVIDSFLALAHDNDDHRHHLLSYSYRDSTDHSENGQRGGIDNFPRTPAFPFSRFFCPLPSIQSSRSLPRSPLKLRNKQRHRGMTDQPGEQPPWNKIHGHH